MKEKGWRLIKFFTSFYSYHLTMDIPFALILYLHSSDPLPLPFPFRDPMYGMNVSVNVDVDLLQRAEALDADLTCIRSRFLVSFMNFPPSIFFEIS